MNFFEPISIYILDLWAIGLLLLTITLGSRWISRIAFSYALIYLVVGVLLGPYGVNLIQVRPNANFIERLTEFVVIVSLFTCGLKINRPLNAWMWNSTIRLIGFLMPFSIFGVAAVSHWLLGIGWGGAILLGAILAPTDPVLASDVQLDNAEDRDELRFGITSEGGLNDALAFPFVYFGLHWLQDSNLDNWFKEWVVVDLIWAIAAGTAVGFVAAKAITWLCQTCRKKQVVDPVMEDFIALSTILISYSLAEIVNGYGFLAVFVAGLTVRRSCSDPQTRSSQQDFTEQIEKLLEIATILMLGALLRIEPILRFAPAGVTIAVLLLFLIRPIGAWLSTMGDRLHPATRILFGWFGIRGVGSLYYLTYAFGEGLSGEVGEQIGWITYWVVIISVVLHGISTTPLMDWYKRNFGESRMEDPPQA